MWVLKLKLSSENQILGNFACKHNVTLMGYPLSYSKKKQFLIASGLIFGEQQDKKKFIKDLQKQKWFFNLELSGDFYIVKIYVPDFYAPLYAPEIIYSKPIVINKEGFHLWNLASFDRKVLENIIGLLDKKLNGKIVSFKQENISNISVTRFLPELTNSQKIALELAVVNGYYDYPKKIKMEELAKKMKISYSTYQAHLKKAEGKLLPAIFSGL